ncbi:ALG6, ALG8 glycosyltransferase family-domain-containing protein [Bombardia bombarda]|uniref:Alpha-1,3-glucosyltransferase n=1 Tax=Bombardia bombarda TaxID=252184 RepID=A0AA39WM10_9PEZI|nr:ALG6, ALG8 glycosyltransferase family-domain-containing protein [Bombardia bombarda]
MAGPSVHKPRRKVQKREGGHTAHDRDANIRRPAFPLAAILWPARGFASQWEILPLILMAAGLFRWAAGLWGYSGFEKPPMFGDYEAQRHWMELTTHLPISQWYFHDLPWWGLDYPPLTAYHSWLCGKIGSLIDPAWFALYTSRGIHDPNLKIFMRATVIVSEYLVFIPAAVVFVRRFSRLSGVANWTASVALVAILMQPATILVDHVHFQYNTVMLGFVLATMSSMLAGRYLWSAVYFVAALGFKQMALYYAFPVFAFLLGSCLFPRVNLARLTGIAIATVAAFTILLLPLIIGTISDVKAGISPEPLLDGDNDLRSPPPPLLNGTALSAYLDPSASYYPIVEQLAQLVHRIFPFARGLFEDKVANFWCALNLVYKLRAFPPALLQRGALLATLAATLPPSLVIFARPDKLLLPLAFATTAWGFFLFSYQVHEKSVLLPLMPMTLLLAGRGGVMARETRAWVGFANLLGCWTIFPLLARVELRVPYAVLTLLWAYLLGLPPTSVSAYFDREDGVDGLGWRGWATAFVHGGFYLFMGFWHVLEMFVKPPAEKPDLWVVMNVGVGAVGFGICYLWCLGRLVGESGILGGGGGVDVVKKRQ